MPEPQYPTNGAIEVIDRSPGSTDLPSNPKPKPREIVEVLRRDYHVPDEVIFALGDAFSAAAVRAVDEVVTAKQSPLPYWLARKFSGSDSWWRR
jgi:hypothetical protein